MTTTKAFGRRSDLASRRPVAHIPSNSRGVNSHETIAASDALAAPQIGARISLFEPVGAAARRLSPAALADAARSLGRAQEHRLVLRFDQRLRLRLVRAAALRRHRQGSVPA